MGRIEIRKVEDLNHIQRKPYPECGGQTVFSNQFCLPENPMSVFVHADAVKALLTNIGWGQFIQRNRTEQGGLLVGHFYDAAPEGDPPEIYAEVEHIIPCCHPEVSEEAYIYMSTDNWNEMYAELDRLNRDRDRELVKVGWYHTHPGNIPTTFSGIDRETQSTVFTYPYSVALVLNPHKKKWTVYCGPECREGRGKFLTDERSMSGERRYSEADRASEERRTSGERKHSEERHLSGEERMSEKQTGSGWIREWQWYDFRRNGSIPGAYTRHQVRANLPKRFQEDVQKSVEWSKHNLCALDQIGYHLEGILLTVGLKTNISKYSEMIPDSSLYLFSVEELWHYESQSSGKCMGILIYRGNPAYIRDDTKLMQLLQRLSMDYLTLWNIEDGTNTGYVFESFIRK